MFTFEICLQVQQQYPLYSHPCSLQILHEDETSPRIPPPPLAVFGGIGVKLTATQMRRARMMNKQMSEDCGRQHLALNRTHQNQHHQQHQGQRPPPKFLKITIMYVLQFLFAQRVQGDFLFGWAYIIGTICSCLEANRYKKSIVQLLSSLGSTPPTLCLPFKIT